MTNPDLFLAGKFTLPASYSIPPAQYLPEKWWRDSLLRLKVVLRYLSVSFANGTASSVRGTRGAVRQNTKLRNWRHLTERSGLSNSVRDALSSQELYRHLCPDLSSAPSTSGNRALRFEPPSAASVSYHYIYKVSSGGHVYANRVLDFANCTAIHHLLFATGKTEIRIADVMLSEAVRFYQKVGITQIYLDAGLSDGGRLWPKYGFLPRDNDEWRKCANFVRDKLKSTPSLASPTRREEIKEILDMVDRKAIWELSDIDDPVPGAPSNYELGSYLLSGSRWAGSLELTDRDSLERFEKHQRR